MEMINIRDVQDRQAGSELLIICDNCRHRFSKPAIFKKDAGQGFILVHLACPFCRKAYPSHYSNARLEKVKKKLDRLERVAGTSAKAGQRYQKELAAFQRERDRVQGLAKELINSV